MEYIVITKFAGWPLISKLEIYKTENENVSRIEKKQRLVMVEL